jgi:squalene-hopene/tetraprenyl-beta-curcumene cyclase
LLLGVSVGCHKSVASKAEVSGKKAAEWLKAQQLEDGTFDKGDPVKVGMTALAVVALMDQNANPNDPNIKRAVDFLAAQQKEDGSIRIQQQIENYETAMSMIALKETGNKAYDDAMKKAASYLKGLQVGVSGNISLDDPSFGGIGYGRRKTPDLSNTQFALEALKASELADSSETFKRATLFIQRCQNLKSVNQQPWASDDGGFMYQPGVSFASPTAQGGEPRHSYGSMSYAGLLSFSYCDVPKDDPRVKAALDWLRAHYTVDENPGMGKEGLYYYYMVMAKALSAYGEKYLVDDKGQKHDWAVDLTNKMIELQRPDGSWVNTEKRWLEDNPSLVTAYCMIALNRCRPFLTQK